MACFMVPMAEALVVSAGNWILKRKQKHGSSSEPEELINAQNKGQDKIFCLKTDIRSRLKRLNALLWGGSFLLAFEHLWHGEIKPFFPFLTAAESPEALSAMWAEVSSVGVFMAISVTAAWALSEIVISRMQRKIPARKMV